MAHMAKLGRGLLLIIALIRCGRKLLTSQKSFVCSFSAWKKQRKISRVASTGLITSGREKMMKEYRMNVLNVKSVEFMVKKKVFSAKGVKEIRKWWF
jgi:hypothetical protein